MNKLSQPAQDLIEQFLHLSVGDSTVHVPYFNNRRAGQRGALRVSVGKGDVADIKEELKIISLREKVDLRELGEEDITKFIVDHKLGIDCSGLVYYILDAELKYRGKGPLKKHISFPYAHGLRKLLTKLRPVENCNVKTLAHEKNSTDVALQNITPGDMIILLNAGPRKDYNHVMLVESVISMNEAERDLDMGLDSSPKGFGMTINYVHSFQYPQDGLYNHGVRRERVHITSPDKPLVEQDWTEEKMAKYITTAEQILVRRLNSM